MVKKFLQAAFVSRGPRISADIEALIEQMARENSGWGYDRMAGALTNLKVSAQTVGNVLKRHGLAPASPSAARTLPGENSSRRIWRSW
jgi:hypothetical protein